MQLHTIPEPWAVWYGRLLHLGCTFIPVLFFHFTVMLSGVYEHEKAKLIAAYAIALAYNLLNLFPGIFTREIVYRLGYAYPRPMGLVYFSYFLFFVTLVLYGLWKLRKTLPHLSKDEARGFHLIIVATSLGYLGGMNNFLIMIDVQLFPLFPFGLYLVVLYAVIASYAINKYHLLQLSVIVPPEASALTTSHISQGSNQPLEIEPPVAQ